MKIATDIEQSKKLAEILPLESADMYYEKRCNLPKVIVGNYSLHMQCMATDKDYKKLTYPVLSPCWSLAALLNVLPKQIGRYTKTLYWFDDAWHCEYVDEESEGKYGETAVNPVDACVEMIIKLKEDNLL